MFIAKEVQIWSQNIGKQKGGYDRLSRWGGIFRVFVFVSNEGLLFSVGLGNLIFHLAHQQVDRLHPS
jgi:hypothetical protein